LQTQSKFRLLVVRLGAMGDILHALPAVTALRIAHPEWIIEWVVEPTWRALLAADGSVGRDTGKEGAMQPLVDRLHIAASKQWRKRVFASQTRSEIKALRRALKSEHYDAVLDLQGALRSAVIGRMASSRRFIGESNPREWAARWLFSERIDTPAAHVIEQDIELASAIAGDALTPVQPFLPTDPAAEAWANERLCSGTDSPAVLINPGAGWGAKRWPVDRYADVARGLLNRGYRVLVNAGPGEVSLADTIMTKTGGGATPLLGSVEQLIAITRRVSLAIAGDTGPLHLACALGCPVVGIYGPTDPSRNGPYGTRFKVLRSPESRRDHTRYETPEAGMLTITPEDVLQAADDLLYSEAAR
jgi:heptosyltransferase-1